MVMDYYGRCKFVIILRMWLSSYSNNLAIPLDAAQINKYPRNRSKK